MTKDIVHDALTDPEVRRAFEEELLVGEATDTIAALLESTGISRQELAGRLGVSPARVSQVLSGSENLTLRSLAAVSWALGLRMELQPSAMADRRGTPAEDDPPAPSWLSAMHSSSGISYRPLPMPGPNRIKLERSLHLVRSSGELAAA